MWPTPGHQLLHLGGTDIRPFYLNEADRFLHAGPQLPVGEQHSCDACGMQESEDVRDMLQNVNNGNRVRVSSPTAAGCMPPAQPTQASVSKQTTQTSADSIAPARRMCVCKISEVAMLMDQAISLTTSVSENCARRHGLARSSDTELHNQGVVHNAQRCASSSQNWKAH